jgi:hypothetical protein
VGADRTIAETPDLATSHAAAVLPAQRVPRDIVAVVAAVARGYMLLDRSRSTPVTDPPPEPPVASG